MTQRPIEAVIRSVMRGQRITQSERERLRAIAREGRRLDAIEALARNAANEVRRLS